MGFTAVASITMLAGRASSVQATALAAAERPVATTTASADDAKAVDDFVALDREASGADRESMIRALLQSGVSVRPVCLLVQAALQCPDALALLLHQPHE